MIKEIGKVTRIENDWMEVKLSARKEYPSCCVKSSSGFGGSGSADRSLKIPFRPGIQEGDWITLGFSESAQNLSALIIFVWPALLFPGTYLLIHNLLQIPYSEIWAVLATFLLYGGSLFLSDRWLSRLPLFQPRIIAVHSQQTNSKQPDNFPNLKEAVIH